jgi:predicted nucleic acid-binding protein
VNLVDSSAWPAYFAGEPNAGFFAGASEDDEALLVPSVCLYVVFKVVLRESGEDAAFAAVAAMERGEVIDLDGELVMEAAALGLEENLASADSVIYAVAKKRDATLWTQDVHFRGKRGVKFRPKGKGRGAIGGTDDVRSPWARCPCHYSERKAVAGRMRAARAAGRRPAIAAAAMIQTGVHASRSQG